MTPFQRNTLHALVCAAWAALLPVATSAAAASAVQTADGSTLKVPAGQTLEIAQTTALNKLVVGEGATLTAPSGYSLTLTVDGVGRPIESKVYTGNVMLTLTEAIPINYSIGPFSYDYQLRTGLYFQDGVLVPAKSVAAIVQAGTVSGGNVDGLLLKSLEPKFNGVMLGGTGSHVITGARIQLVGNGGNDFVGFGAAIRAVDNTQLTLSGARIRTTGPIRPAVFAGDNAVVTVKNSSIETSSGTLPADYDPTVIMPGKMYAVPWVLGVSGNNRATLATGSSVVSYVKSHIKAQAWGALSTDAVTKVRLSATNSLVEVVDSGYGAYADGNSLDTFSATTFNVADMATIISSGSASAEFKNGCVVNSGRFGVMVHSNTSGTLTVTDSSFNTQAAVFQFKSSTTKLRVNRAVLNAANGLIVQAVANDDPVGASMGYPSGGSNVDAVFSNSVLTGDILNGNSQAGTVAVALKSTQLTGAISTANTVHATDANGNTPTTSTPELYKLIGEFTHTNAATGYGMSVTLDAGSKWTVSKTSYLSSLRLAAGATLSAPDGKTLSLSVDGVAKPIQAGKSYSGAIVLAVN
jgi:hypothetical protein